MAVTPRTSQNKQYDCCNVKQKDGTYLLIEALSNLDYIHCTSKIRHYAPICDTLQIHPYEHTPQAPRGAPVKLLQFALLNKISFG